MEKLIRKMNLLADHIEDLVLNYSQYPHMYRHRPNSPGDTVHFGKNETWYIRLYFPEACKDRTQSIFSFNNGGIFYFQNTQEVTDFGTEPVYEFITIDDDTEAKLFQLAMMMDHKELEVILLFSIFRHRNLPSFFMERDVYYYYNEITGK